MGAAGQAGHGHGSRGCMGSDSDGGSLRQARGHAMAMRGRGGQGSRLERRTTAAAAAKTAMSGGGDMGTCEAEPAKTQRLRGIVARGPRAGQGFHMRCGPAGTSEKGRGSQSGS
jgi:hypothetical protein